MSSKFDAMTTILKKLDQRHTVTVQGLMDELEISQRTAYRYLNTLQSARFPISFDRQKQSYVFDKGYNLGKPDLSIEETLSLAMAKKLLFDLGTGMEKGIQSIERKLFIQNNDRLPRHIILQSNAQLQEAARNSLEKLYQAINDYRRVELSYASLYANEETIRKVDPCYLFFEDDYWYLRGYCHLREEFRTFAVDRIRVVKILDEHFIPRNISPQDELSGAFGAFIDGELTQVELLFDSEITPYVMRRNWHHSQKTETLPDGRVKIAFTVNWCDEFKSWIYRWLPYVKVLRPKSLRDEIATDLEIAIKNI